ncbi:hypothetical protein [Actinacidiphila glaucinigra]|uniref:Uncharacterized protein n=1 Tax=Actinacidiphila glaucinigra TaxID=235986 RepID=A0A239EQL0_9ACTN|nr:hypothetical protein [Actinacidiphila glaucinigra]MDX2852271.1 hypothetical protein [Streptomyces sp. PA03-3a]WSD60255.1 hypothetical protein OIE69_15645 [Actinacidiphila glaucinigra]SNS46313.1 hypothetical protein SAMN05216252_10678 [Actinacidiphila glaucinigra]
MKRPAVGTIDRPLTHDPKKQAPMNPSVTERPAPPSDAPTERQNRNLEMQLMPEALARAHMQERLYEAEHERMALRVLNARRLQRRAERASLRARRALAMAVMQ